jgi:hypothetical protein
MCSGKQRRKEVVMAQAVSPMRKSTDRLALISGALAGVAGLLVFLVLHALWILPIWFILPVGLIFALAGGVVMGWAYAQLRPTLPKGVWTAPAWIGLVAVTLLPAIALAELRPTLFVETPTGAIPSEPIPTLIARFVAELLITATIVGGLIGWWLRRTRRAMAVTALASFVFALGPGHNIPFLGGTRGVRTELALLAAVIVVATLVLVEAHRLLTSQARRDRAARNAAAESGATSWREL